MAVSGHTAISLHELNSRVRAALSLSLDPVYWVLAEIGELSIHPAGHCFLELVEKKENEDGLMARAKATIWASTFRMLKPYFESTARRELSPGLKVLMQVTVDFHELYGYSLNVRDIDPAYTIGELGRRKDEVIQRLLGDGIIDMNKELDFPVLPRRIAIISSPSAAGYGDFMDHLANNNHGFRFYTKLFPALMQGEAAEDSILVALDKINEHCELFDTVVIIRGGGAKLDLDCFNGYNLAYHVAQFPIPVLTGIGHERDDTVADLVAYSRFKTPTAVADFLVECMMAARDEVEMLFSSIMEAVGDILLEEKSTLINASQKLRLLTSLKVTNEQNRLSAARDRLKSGVGYLWVLHAKNIEMCGSRLDSQVKSSFGLAANKLKTLAGKIKLAALAYLVNHQHQLAISGQRLYYLDPARMIKRGYSITRVNGKVIKSVKDVPDSVTIETLLLDGRIESRVTNTSTHDTKKQLDEKS